MFARFTRREKITVSIYLSLFAFLLIVTGFSARHVIFKPWTARNWVSAVEVSGRVYVFGGLGKGNRVYDDILMIDLNSRKLVHVSKLPSPRFATQAVYYNGSIYIVGGFDGKRYYNEVVRFDLTSRKAETVFYLKEPRCFGSLVKTDMLYYLGGWNGKRYLDTIIEINPKVKSSRIVGKLPYSLEHLSACTTRRSILIIGGEGADMKYRKEIIELEKGTWKVIGKGELPAPIIRTACVFVEDGVGDEVGNRPGDKPGYRVICAGGWNGRELDDVISIELRGEKELHVKRIARLPRGMADIAMVEYEKSLYLIGGTSAKSNRQIGLLNINLDTGKSNDIVLKSYSWR